jgi:surface protein
MKFNNETLRAAVKEWLDDESKAEKKYGHISDWDTSEVKNMREIFYKAESFNQPLEKWDVSYVTHMSRMFDAAESFNQPLDKWNVGNAADMSEMFWGGWQVNSLINTLETSFNKKSES